MESLLFFLQANQLLLGGSRRGEGDVSRVQVGGLDCLLETTSVAARFYTMMIIPLVVLVQSN